MAKVVLVWNEHPTEVVAGFHARKVAEILREKYGHEVILEKIPVSETNYGIIRDEPSPKVAAERLAKLKGSSLIAEDYARKYGAPAFNFHASPTMAQGQSGRKPAWRFKVGKTDPTKRTWTQHEIDFLPWKQGTVIELPGELYASGAGSLGRMEVKRTRVEDEAKKLQGDAKIVAEMASQINYVSLSMPLHEETQKKYLSPIISRKIAAAIHKQVTGEKWFHIGRKLKRVINRNRV
ncbi:MAG: hypothetical protein V1722_00430 [Candidatus Micrarchaeota archaeon]